MLGTYKTFYYEIKYIKIPESVIRFNCVLRERVFRKLNFHLKLVIRRKLDFQSTYLLKLIHITNPGYYMQFRSNSIDRFLFPEVSSRR